MEKNSFRQNVKGSVAIPVDCSGLECREELLLWGVEHPQQLRLGWDDCLPFYSNHSVYSLMVGPPGGIVLAHQPGLGGVPSGYQPLERGARRAVGILAL